MDDELKKKDRLFLACKMAYKKHCLADDSIGWVELEDILQAALCESMGDKAFQKMLKEYNSE